MDGSDAADKWEEIGGREATDASCAYPSSRSSDYRSHPVLA